MTMVPKQLAHVSQKANELLVYESLMIDDPASRQFRLEAIHANKVWHRKLGALCLHHTATFVGHAIKNHLIGQYRTSGYEYIGTGAHSSALRDTEGGKVVKIIRCSASMDPQTRTEHADRLQSLIGFTTNCHPDNALDTTVHHDFVMSHDSKRKYVALSQDFTSGNCALDEPEAQAELQEFAERSLDIMAPQGVAPDMHGRRNILYTHDGHVMLVDTVPLDKSDPATRTGLYMQNLEILRHMATKKRKNSP